VALVTEIDDTPAPPIGTTKTCPTPECAMRACFKTAIESAIKNEVGVDFVDSEQDACAKGGHIECWIDGGNVLNQRSEAKIGGCGFNEKIQAFANISVKLYGCDAGKNCEAGRIMHNIRCHLAQSKFARRYQLKRIEFKEIDDKKARYEYRADRFEVCYQDNPTKILPPPK